MTLAYLAK